MITPASDFKIKVKVKGFLTLMLSEMANHKKNIHKDRKPCYRSKARLLLQKDTQMDKREQ